MSTFARSNMTDQPNQVQKGKPARVKQQSTIPGTRRVLGDVSNGPIHPVQKLSANPRKPLTVQQTNISRKDFTKVKKHEGKSEVNHVADDTESSKLSSVKPAIPESPVTMVIGTPCKTASEETNVFDLELKPEVEDIDKNDADNPQLCSEFVNDIYQYMFYLERIYPIRQGYLKDSCLKPRMRCILVDWLIQVHHRFELLQETLYLTVAILDRFLQSNPVPRAKLQLVGVTAMLIAAKYEEIYAPEVNDFVYITDKAFTQSEILSMEVIMLKALEFNLGRPLPLHFLRRNSKAGQVDHVQHTLAKYLMELSLIDYAMCHLPPSILAAAALCLSIKLLDDAEWSPTLEHYSTYAKENIQPVICHLAKNLKSAESSTYQKAIKTKYGSQKFIKISRIQEIKSPLVSELAEQATSLNF